MIEDLVRRYSKPVPRYTSYPTAPHFHTGVDRVTYAEWLRLVPRDTDLSLYVHVPFCDRLCWFCGCHTKQVARYDPIAAYIPVVMREIEAVAKLLDGQGRVTALHLGGGSPSMLRRADLFRLSALIRQNFTVARDFEFSIEVDPNDMVPERYDDLAEAGVTRVSIGVQDFDPEVQRAINRLQSFEQTAAVVEGMRARGVGSVNLDVLYGLPHQTLEGLERTVAQSLSLRPDRLALFGYAHVPWMKTHQRMIPDAALPGIIERFSQSAMAASAIRDAGYEAIGIDHFALPSDKLAQSARGKSLRRNFQGYTTDAAPALIGFGASAIGSLPQGYVQNHVPTGEYVRQVNEHGLAAVRGVALTQEDRMRRWVIERLMCDFAVPLEELMDRFGPAAEAVAAEMLGVAFEDSDGLVDFTGDSFTMTEKGRPFVRSIAAAFDSYLAAGKARHSLAV
jgi:oxygen-independent coproporphyrinogen III oxidase